MKKTRKVDPPFPPVRIQKVVHGGAGLGFAGGPVFIPLTAPGDLVAPAGVRRAKGVFFAEPGEFLEYSASRRDPPCPWFGECGGCQWMHMHYADQIKWKGVVVEETLRGIGKLGGMKLDGVNRSAAELGYRHRARLHIEGQIAGFFRRRSNTVVDWDRCLLLPDRLNSAVPILRALLSDGTVMPYPKSLEVALSPVDEALTLCWYMGSSSLHSRDLERAADIVEQGLAGAGYRTAGQVFTGARGRELIRRGSALKLSVRGESLRASPGAFFQVNPGMNEILVEKVLDRLRRRGVRKLLDLFCGNGNFSVPAARMGMDIEAVDSDPVSIRDARAVADEGCRFHELDVGQFLVEESGPWDAVLVDPPRTGLTIGLIRKLVTMTAGVLVYVSCEPATLARDLALLVGGGYVLRSLEVFDMFPQTRHAEVVAEMKWGPK